MSRFLIILTAGAVLLAATGCGGSSTTSSGAAGGSPVNGGTLQGGIPDDPDHLDTGLSYAVEGWEILEATNNGLVTFKKASGPAGSEVVPDMATAMPTVTDGGTTYTFHLHPGIKFGPPVNRVVKPSDFQYSIERLFHDGSPGVGFYTSIVGADAYAAHKATHISGIVADDKTNTITFHLVHPDGAFLDIMAMPFAFAVPRERPTRTSPPIRSGGWPPAPTWCPPTRRTRTSLWCATPRSSSGRPTHRTAT